MQIIINKVMQENTYLFKMDDKMVLIDPGSDYESILKACSTTQIDLILLTHFHFDHVFSVNQLCSKFKIKAYIHYLEKEMVARDTLALLFGFEQVNVQEKYLQSFENKINVLPSLKLWHAPGHSPGSTLFQFESLLFTGDVLFAKTIGRTDLPNGNLNQMKKSLNKIRNLPSSLKILPGHGKSNSLKLNLKQNPFWNLVFD